MNIKRAIFIIDHKKQTFQVDMNVQDTNANQRRAIVTVSAPFTGKIFLHQSMSGRQLICVETAKTAIKQYLKNESKKNTTTDH